MFSQELGSLLLGITTNLANHHNTLGVLILQENVQTINEVGTIEWITTNTNAKSLTKTSLSGLMDGLYFKVLVKYIFSTLQQKVFKNIRVEHTS